MSSTTFVPQSEVVQRCNIEVVVPMIRQLTLELAANPELTPEMATARAFGMLRHSVHPDLGEALHELNEVLRGRFVDAYMEKWNAANEGRTI